MEFLVYRDIASIAYVRCISPIPGTSVNAEGAGFSIGSAKAKCRSEAIERSFVRDLPEKNLVLGIAAHPIEASAIENAFCETLETLMLEKLKQKAFNGIPLWHGSKKLWIGRINKRWITLFIFPHDGALSAVGCVSRKVFKSILKSWSEYRNLKIYKPSARELPRYTRANRILGSHRISQLRINFSFRENFIPTEAKLNSVKFQNHFVSYFLKEKRV